MKTLITLILIFVPTSQSFAECTPMANGQIDYVSSTRTTLKADYKIKRQDNNYTITLFPNFVDESGSPLADSQVNELIEKYNKCSDFAGGIKTYGPEFENSAIRIRYAKVNEKPAGIDAPKITVFTATGRRDARATKWPKNMTCEVQMHETFHLLGLVDLYDETKQEDFTDDIPSYNCRATATRPSMMSDQTFLNLAKPTIIPVLCQCSRSACRAQLNTLKDVNDCQKIGGQVQRLEPVNTVAAFNQNKDIESLYGKIGEWKQTGDWYSRTLIVEEPRMKWHIYPAEFEFLVNSSRSCDQQHEKYLACTANAYKTSKDHNGDGCLQTPSFCSNPQAWLQLSNTPTTMIASVPIQAPRVISATPVTAAAPAQSQAAVLFQSLVKERLSSTQNE